MKWTMENAIGHAYGKLVTENKMLKQLLASERAAKIGETIDKAFADIASNFNISAETDDGKQAVECDCPICTARRAMEKATADAKTPPKGGTEVKFTSAPEPKNVHPWDMEYPEAGNPLGLTARQFITSLRTELEEVNKRTILLEQENKEFRARNTALQAAAREARDQSQIDGCMVTSRYQLAVVNQIDRLWGTTARHNLTERVQRFLEEAIELAQSCGFPAHKIPAIVTWVYDRPKGPADREVGGTMVTLAGLCARISIDLPEAAITELQRISDKSSEEMRGRHNAKPDNIRTV